MGIVCFILYGFYLNHHQALIALLCVGGLLVLADIARLAFPHLTAVALRCFGRVMREEELTGLSANTFYILGLFTLLLFFPKPIALLSLLYLAVGDPIAALVGVRFGRHRLLRNKSWEGTLANFALTTAATALAGHKVFGLAPQTLLVLAPLGGIISALSELLPLPLDDNFTIPVASAIQLSFLLPYLHLMHF